MTPPAKFTAVTATAMYGFPGAAYGRHQLGMDQLGPSRRV
jgi:hypothetical protein